MTQVKLEKITLNIGAGEGGDKLQNAKTLLERISGTKAIITKAHRREPAFKVKQGDPIGVKVTLRGAAAKAMLKRALESRDGYVPSKSFDEYGNVSFGIREYIDFPGAKYDPKLGMMGFDVCLTLTKAGKRVGLRKVRRSKAHRRQRVSAQEAREYLVSEFNAVLEKAERQ